MIIPTILLLATCKKDVPAPAVTFAVTTYDHSGLTSPQVTLKGKVESDGGSAVNKRGMVVGDATDPVITNTQNYISNLGSGVGEFSETINISKLKAGLTLYYRAYVTNSSCTA